VSLEYVEEILVGK